MSLIDELLQANQSYAATPPTVTNSKPARRLAVITCMDARIEPMSVLGLQLGDIHVIRNAGGRVTDDVLRSLALSGHELGVDTVVVMQHTSCGLEGATQEELRGATGADLAFLPITDHDSALREDIQVLSATPYLAPITTFAGMIYDVASGVVTEVARWDRPSE